MALKQYDLLTDVRRVIGSVFNTTFSTLRERWLPMLLTMLAPMVALLVVLLVLVPVMMGALSSSGAGSTTSGSGAISVTSEQFGSATTVDPATGAMQMSPVVAPQAEPAGPGIGTLVMLLAAMAVIAVLSIAMASMGVYAAAGLDAREAIIEGMRTSPHVLVQTLILSWKPIIAYVAGIASMFLLGGVGALLALPLMVAAMVLYVRATAFSMLAMGSVAHGHVSYTPDATRAAIEGRTWTVTGVGFVGALAGAVANLVPLAGPLFMAAYASAMWEEIGEDGGPSPAATLDVPPGTDAPAPAPVAASSDAVASAVPVVDAVAPVVPAAPAPMVAGPAWQGMASAAEPAGSWVELAAPSAIGLQVQWTTGEAPVLHLADQAGVWTTPDVQPSVSGEAIWVQLGAGFTWCALIPRGEHPQQVWAATMLPPASSAPAAVAA